MMKKIILLCCFCCTISAVWAGTDEKELMAVFNTLEALAGESADARILEEHLCREFRDTSSPLMQCALGMTALRQGIDASGSERREILLTAEKRLSAATAVENEELKELVQVELARTLFLLADCSGGGDFEGNREIAELCGRAFTLLSSVEPADNGGRIRRDTLMYLLCFKTGFVSGMTEYKKRIAAAGGDVDGLPVVHVQSQEIPEHNWILTEDPSGNGGFTLTGDGFTASAYRLPAEEFPEEEFPVFLKLFTEPVLERSLEGRLDICSFTAKNGKTAGVYGVLTDKEWQKGDGEKGSKQYVVPALFGGGGKEVLYLVIFSDFHFSRELEEILEYSAGFAAGN